MGSSWPKRKAVAQVTEIGGGGGLRWGVDGVGVARSGSVAQNMEDGNHGPADVSGF